MESTPPDPPKVAVVTGANRGLGRALAACLARSGMRVSLTARRLDDAERAAEEVGREHSVLVQPAELDIADAASVNRLFTDIEAAYGRLDVLVNNAAVAIDRDQSPSQLDIETAARTFEINLLGTVRCCKHAVRLMRLHGYGRITNISSHMSLPARVDRPTSPAYGASKAAVNHYTRTLAAETRNENILVNAGSPGTVRTRMNNQNARYSPDQAAEQLAWLSMLPADGPTGQFFAGREHLAW